MNDPAGRYVQLLCHDMNNPLTILYGQASLMNAALGAAEIDHARLRAIVAQVEVQTGRVIGLVAEMRDAFRQIDGEDVHATVLEPVIREAASFVTRLWRYRAGQLDLELDQNVVVDVRPLATRGALWRMLAAAVDRSPRVAVRLDQAGSACRLIVAESGGAPGPARPLDACVARDLARSGWRVEPWRSGTETGWLLAHELTDVPTPD